MKEMVLANRYAKALVDLGLEEKCLERFKDEAARLKKAVQAEPRLLKILSYRELSFAKREAIVAELSQKMMLSGPVKNILRLLLKRDRILLLPSVLEAF
ncbi:MAG: F0F1 ATP synthase subunit delta, partial [bacterium]|nr:F0F1 ATP synthase subunit delta [bacterium]